MLCSYGPVFIYFAISAHISVIMKAHAPLRDLNVHYHQRLLILCFHVCAGSILYALWPVLTILWLGYPLSATQFFTIWSFIWLGMTAFGSNFLMSYHVFGESVGAIINIIFYTIGTGSGGATVPHELQNSFFLIGKGLPYYNIVQGLRSILFNSGDTLGANVGVQLIWVLASFVLAWRLTARRKIAHRAKLYFKNDT
jgi:Protein of unknown function (DUF3533)